MNIGFIGTGQIGAPMARRILDAGFPLTVHDVAPAAMAPLVEAGAKAAASPRAVADVAEVVFCCLPKPDICREVALGPDGVAGGAALKVYVELSGMGPEMVRLIADALRETGVETLDSPISGGRGRAVAGTLITMTAGPKAAFEHARPAMAAFSERQFHVGEAPGLGQICKLVNNAMGLTGIAIASEAITIGVKAGVNADILLDVINAGSGRNWATVTHFPNSVLPRTFNSGAYLENGVKDLTNYLALAQELGIPAWIGTAARELRRTAVAELGPRQDSSRLVQLVERWAGVEVKGGG